MWPFFQPPRKRTSHRLVVEELGQAVVAGEFAVGAILPGDVELAARFNVSRTVLREAMKTLAAKGLVVAPPPNRTPGIPPTSW